MNHELIAEYLKQIDLAENEHSPWRRSDYADGLVDILRDYFTDDELIELVQAKAEGRLVVLPCKVGDVVWKIKAVFSYFSKPMEDRVDRIIISNNEILVCCTGGAKFSIDSIGKTVFLTREAAEKALSPICNTTKLQCAECNPCCEHRAKS